MKNTHASRIRSHLLEHTFGLTVAQISERMRINKNNVRVNLNLMPDAYIAMWVRTPKGLGHTAVWKVAGMGEPVPPNSPRPEPHAKSVAAYKKRQLDKWRYENKLKRMALPEEDLPPPQPKAPEPYRPRTVWVQL